MKVLFKLSTAGIKDFVEKFKGTQREKVKIMRDVAQIYKEELIFSASNLMKSQENRWIKRSRASLQDSIRIREYNIGKGTGFDIGSSLPYAWMHEKKETIAPGKKMTIPVPGKLPPRAASLIGKKGYFIQNNIIFQAVGKGKDRQKIALYYLKDSVTIPGQKWRTKAEKRASPRVEREINKLWQQTL